MIVMKYATASNANARQRLTLGLSAIVIPASFVLITSIASG
jgi:hypothetical protein